MRPHLRARMPGKTACVQRNADFRFTAIVRSKSASVTVSMVRLRPTPALLTRMSIGPSSVGNALDHAADRHALRHVSLDRQGPPAAMPDRSGDLVSLGRTFPVIDGDSGAGVRKRCCDRGADPARGAGDQRHAIIEIGIRADVDRCRGKWTAGRDFSQIYYIASLWQCQAGATNRLGCR